MWYALIGFAVLIFVFTMKMISGERQRKKAKRLFLAEHVSMSDESFFEQLKSPREHYDLVIDIRKYLGQFCEIDPKFIHPTDPVSCLTNLIWDFIGELRSIGRQIEIDYKMSKVRLKYKEWMRLEDSMVKEQKTVHDFIAEIIYRVEDAFMADEQFCDALGLQEPLERTICILIRNESARCFRLTPDKVAADSPTMPLNERAMTPFIASDIAPWVEDEISKLLGINMDLDSIFQRMDSELPFSRQWFGRKEEAKTFGQWTLKLTKMIREHITPDFPCKP